jgi:O-6-methylguanine DNA methyltransferase
MSNFRNTLIYIAILKFCVATKTILFSLVTMDGKKIFKHPYTCRVIVHHPLVAVIVHGVEKNGRVVIGTVRFKQKISQKGEKSLVHPHPDLVEYGRMIRGFLDGSIRDLSSVPVDISNSTAFSKKIIRITRSVPWGTTVSYARLAAMAGNSKAVRAVASVMRNNPFPLIVPCHRVIKSDGSIGGFMGKTRGRAVQLKNELLKREFKSKQ